MSGNHSALEILPGLRSSCAILASPLLLLCTAEFVDGGRRGSGEAGLRAAEAAEAAQILLRSLYQRLLRNSSKKPPFHITTHWPPSLSKEAAKVQGSRFPEMGAFEGSQGDSFPG
uniref:Uncharacterized protein n=1 Tax=Sphaerodactylus townsendi TaxID=933632 RepID=A0ACB8F6U1_9SAUR